MALDKYLVAVQQFPCESLDVTLGRSGTLLGATFLLNAIKGCKYLNSTALRVFGDGMMRKIWEELDAFRPIRECKQMTYSGAAHGWAGILYTTLNWCKVSGSKFPKEMEERLSQLAGLAECYGRRRRWKWNLRKGGSGEQAPYMAGWCNGSAGFVFLWTLAHRMLGRSEYAALADGAAFDCWESDSQIGNLCCGYAGQAYALLNLYKHTGQTSWLHRAQALTQKAARTIRDMPAVDAHLDLVLRGDSLYKGQVGVALLAAELDRPEFAAMPFFEVDE
jgi:serine/threonine-protein kinase